MTTMQEIDRRSRAMNQLFYNLRQTDMTYREIGEMMGVSPEWAWRRVLIYGRLIKSGWVKS